MKYIVKLTIFALLGLLVVSCSKSSSSSKHNASIKLQGVLEKGKATDALCKISTLDGKYYSKSNHIGNGGYVATVPAGAFDVTCTISKYIDDKTGKPVIPAKPIVLEAISFAKAGKDITVNVNVITDLVAKELEKSKGKIKDEKSFNSAKEDAKNTALKGILSTQSTIEDIDTLHLDRTQGNVLTKVSLAIQEQIDDPNSHITTVSGALQAAESANSIATQDVNDLSLDAIATLPNNIQPSKLTGQTQKITLIGATIGGVDVTTSPTNIDASNSVVFSLPANDLGQVVASDSVYITSNKAGATIPIKLKGGKTAPYTASNVKDLFKTDGATTFTICVVTAMAKLDSVANGQCQSADRKISFTATAATSSTEAGGAAVTATETGNTTGQGTIAVLTTATTLGGTDVTTSPSAVNTMDKVPFSMPASLVENLGIDGVYITSDKTDASLLPVVILADKTKYENANVRELFKLDATATKFTICILPAKTNASDCLGSTEKQSFTATASDSIKHFVGEDNVTLDSWPIFDGQSVVYDTVLPLPLVIPTNIVIKTADKKVYITSDKTGAGVLPVTISADKIKYENVDIRELFKLNGKDTTFTLCIFSPTPTSETCKTARAKQIFQSSAKIPPFVSTATIASLTATTTMNKTPVTTGRVREKDNNMVTFSMPSGLVKLDSTKESVYLTSDKPGVSILKLSNNNGNNGNYETKLSVHVFFNTDKVTTFTICVLSSDIANNDVDSCLNAHGKQTFTAVLAPIFITLTNTKLADKPTFPRQKDIDSTHPVSLTIPVGNVKNLFDDIIYITSDKPKATFLPLSLSNNKANYENDDIKDLFKTDGSTTTFEICTFPKDVEPTKAICQAEYDDRDLGTGFWATATQN